MACTLPVLIVILAMTSSVLSLHPRFRFWLPTFDYQLQSSRPTSVVLANENRHSDRPTVRRMYGNTRRGALSLSRDPPPLPSTDVTSSQLSSRKKGLVRILRIRRLLEKIAQDVSQQNSGRPAATQ